MSRKRYKPEQIIGMLGQTEVELARGKRMGEACRSLGISEQSYYRWRSKYGGLKLDQARRMKDLEKENGRLKKVVAELTLDKRFLKEALAGNFQALNADASGSRTCSSSWAFRSGGRAARLASRAQPNASLGWRGRAKRF
jgi:putative transposase